MEKQFLVFIGIVAVIVAISLGFFLVNGTLFPTLEVGGTTEVSNLSFKASAVPDGNYLIFRYTPSANVTGPFTATYQVQKDAKAIINDKKIFESVTPDNPIEIVIKQSDNGTYSMIMLITDNEKNLLHKRLHILV